jgi:carboxypeptidase Q
MPKITIYFLIALLCGSSLAQERDHVIDSIINEANKNSQLERLAHELMDVVGPRLTGTPQMKNGNDWVVSQYKNWDISAKNEKWGEWRGWERGITHIDMVYPRVQTLKGTQLAWSPSTTNKGATGEVVVFPKFDNYYAFRNWLPNVKDKFVMISMKQPTGRSDYNWEEFATEESFNKMKMERDSLTLVWQENMTNTGYSNHRKDARLNNAGIAVLEEAGALGIISSRWTGDFAANKIFDASTTKIPTVDMELEDYGMLYRIAEYGGKPKINIVAKSKKLGTVPTFNTIAEIKGTEKPEEYVILSAHLDSWDGATGATDNGTGTIIMMEAMRILKKIYPNPKRTILVGHWAFEEGGLNGSRAFIEDHPEIVKNVQAVFNQDNGTGRIEEITGSGFLHTSDYLGRWLSAVPEDVTKHIKTDFPGMPTGGGSDHSSFIAVGIPAFRLSSLSWSYDNYTWHTNRDTYDKIVFDDVRNNVILTAILAYMASEDPERASNEKIDMPIDPNTGKQKTWPVQKYSKRSWKY